MKNKLIIFDFDGPILDSWIFAYERTRRNWPNISHEQHRNLFNGNIHDELAKLGPPKQTPEEEKEWLDNVYFPDKLKVKPVDGIKEAIQELKGYTLVINTSSLKEEVEKYLAEHNFSNFFSDVFGSELATSKEEKFKFILDKYELNPEDSVLITDTIGDVIEAEKVGIASILVSWGYQNESHFSRIKGRYFYLAHKPEELIKTIESFFKNKIDKKSLD